MRQILFFLLVICICSCQTTSFAIRFNADEQTLASGRYKIRSMMIEEIVEPLQEAGRDTVRVAYIDENMRNAILSMRRMEEPEWRYIKRDYPVRVHGSVKLNGTTSFYKCFLRGNSNFPDSITDEVIAIRDIFKPSSAYRLSIPIQFGKAGSGEARYTFIFNNAMQICRWNESTEFTPDQPYLHPRIPCYPSL